MLLYFKKRKFRKFIKECGILKNKEMRIKYWYSEKVRYIRKVLKEWEQDILYEEINKLEINKLEKKEEKDRKSFLDKWTIK